MITVIVPHARPEFTENLLANFRRQRGVDAQLVVVENGDAVGSLEFGVHGTILVSDEHQADAMNVGLEWLRLGGGGPWARFDDDDYYGPDYLAAVERSFDQSQELDGAGVVVSGMPWRFVMLDDGLHQFTGTGPFTGGSLAASSADVVPFERFRDDDLRWHKAMHKRGVLFVERKPWGYCYDRRTRLASRVVLGGSVVTRFSFGSSLFYGPVPINSVDDTGLKVRARLGAPSDAEVFEAMKTM